MNPEIVEWFGQYARLVAERFSDRVKYFFTLNEPQCFVVLGFLQGCHAPGVKAPLRDTFEMAHNALKAHGRAVQMLRAYGKQNVQIGYAPTSGMCYPEKETPKDIEAARKALFALPDDLSNWTWNVSWWSDPVILGKYPEEGMKKYEKSDGEFSMDRAEAIEKLKNGEIKVIFSVDMFNEGVDIPSVDMVMFLRPTESPVVFLQQLGRGLRRSKGKEYLNVLDFIGNYEKAGRVRYLLIGKNKTGKETYYPADKADYPDECFVDFDMRLIDLFAEMDKKQLTIKEQIRNEYFRIKELLGKQPTRMDLFTYMDDDVYQMAVTHSNENPFKKYLNYLEELDELTDEQKKFSQGMGKDFINLLENTNMSKVYKMPVLMAFYNHGNVRMEVSEVELLASWKKFFSTGTNWKDLEKEITYEEYRKISDKNHIQKIMKMPVRFLLKSGEEFFVKKDGAALALRDEMEEIVKEPVLAEQMKDVIEYRAMDYYRRRYKEQIKALL